MNVPILQVMVRKDQFSTVQKIIPAHEFPIWISGWGNETIHEVWEVVYHICQEYFPTASNTIHYLPDQPNEAQITLANIDKAKEHLNWKPKISFDKGVGKTIANLWEMRNDS